MTALKDTPPTDDTQLHDQAVERLKKRQDLRAHVLVFTLFNAAVWAIWALTSGGGFMWPAIVTALWGIGLVMNAWDVYGRRPITESAVRHEMDRLSKP